MLEFYQPEIHYNTLMKWWTDHGWIAVPKPMLPKTGLIVNGCVAGFLYQTDSSLAWLEWVVSDKDADKDLKNKSIIILIDELTSIAKDMGFEQIWSWLEHPKLIDYFKANGYVVTDTNMTNVLKRL